MSKDLRHWLGRVGEQLAVQHFEEELGFRVIARNYRTRFGEIDLVAADADTIVFCEVKTRRAGPASVPWDALHQRKRMKVRSMARAWLAEVEDRPRRANLRFDAVGVIIDARGVVVSLEHRPDAF